jgi:RND family efflux transporter MFP subunit
MHPRLRFRTAAALNACATLLLGALALSTAHAQDEPQSVRVVRAESGGIGESLALTGTLTAVRDAGLSPRIDGLVSDIEVDAGSRVQRGDVLLRLDDALARAAVDQAEAMLAAASAQRDEATRRVGEAEPLVEARSLPRTELEARRAALASAEAGRAAAAAELAQRREELRRHVLTAPFDGVIAERMSEVGEWVLRGSAVMRLVALSPIRLDVQVPQERFDAIDGDIAASIEPDMHQGEQLPARIEARVPVGDGSARSFLLRLTADTGDLTLLPGTSARARFSLPASAGVRIPRDALLRHADGGYSVFIAAGDPPRAQRRNLRLGRDADGQVEVLEGLEAGVQVVVRGNEGLREGQPLRLLEGEDG